MKKIDLEQFEACREAVVWYKDFKTPQEAWSTCPRGDWMLWIAQKLGVNKRLLTLAKGRCAETVIHLMEDERSVKAVKIAIAYGKGEVSEEELREAAAYAAAYAAFAATAAAYAAAARQENRKLTADICREILTDEVFKLIKTN